LLAFGNVWRFRPSFGKNVSDFLRNTK